MDQQKVQHSWSIICERAIIDSTTKNLSITNILEEIQITPVPNTDMGAIINNEITIPLSAQLVSTFRKSTSSEYNGEIKISVIDPNNSVLNTSTHPVKVPANSNRFRGIIGFQGFKVTISGEYKFLIEIKEDRDKTFKKAGEVYFDVKIALPRGQNR